LYRPQGIDAIEDRGYPDFMLVIFTDLDGTLLDEKDYSHDAALPALERVKELGIPLVLVTSKTSAEVEVWRKRLESFDPFIVENGGALYMPRAYFPLTLMTPAIRDGYAVIEFGDPYAILVDVLRTASAESQCRVLGFHEMSAVEVSYRCRMSIEQATLAKQREYDEPFEIIDGQVELLLERIEAHEKRWTRGGHYYHITGANDKAHCVRLLIHFYQRAFGEITAVGLGDGLNDARFLRAVDIPIVLRSPDSARLEAMVPQARVSDLSGPEGWNREILNILEKDKNQTEQMRSIHPAIKASQ
jgi:mannosyl-3-phosphoglycerate phosphatase